MPPKYSFVLPAYKAAFLGESIDSILNQSHKDFELIIVNDASPEDLTSIVNSYHDERIQYYINEKNVGGTDLVAQWNHCITYAKGEYLILASDDDIYHPDYLEKMDVLVDRYPNIDVFFPRVQYIDESGKITTECDALAENLSFIDFLFLRHKGQIPLGIPFFIFKRVELDRNGGIVNFPTAWFSDDATVIRLARKGVVTHRDVLFSFRMSGLNISSVLNSMEMLKKKLLATEAFYFWYVDELKVVDVLTDEEKKKMDLVRSSLREMELRHMTWLICCSERKALLLCWCLLWKIKSLKILERMMICRNVFNLKTKKGKTNI